MTVEPRRTSPAADLDSVTLDGGAGKAQGLSLLDHLLAAMDLMNQPGQASGLQETISELSPEHWDPLPKGEGLVHALVPVLVPPPHVTEHEP